MKLNYEKYMKKLYMLLNACEAPACISEEMADDIYEDVADTEAENKTLRHDLSEERKTTKTLSVALAEIYRTVYGYEPSALFPIEGTLENIQKHIENMKRRSKAFSGSLVGPSKEESTIKYLEQCIRHIHSKLKCPDSDVKDMEAVLEEIYIRIGSLLMLTKSGFEEVNKKVTEEPKVEEDQMLCAFCWSVTPRLDAEALAEWVDRHWMRLRHGAGYACEACTKVAERAFKARQDEIPRIELEAFIEKLHKAVYGEPEFTTKELKTHFLHRLITTIQRDKEERVKCAELENEIARLKHETSSLRFAENSALEKKAEVWAIKAIEYRLMLGAIEKRLRDMWIPKYMREAEDEGAPSVDAAEVEELADLIKSEMER
jgi:hypothetical protein